MNLQEISPPLGKGKPLAPPVNEKKTFKSPKAAAFSFLWVKSMLTIIADSDHNRYALNIKKWKCHFHVNIIRLPSRES